MVGILKYSSAFAYPIPVLGVLRSDLRHKNRVLYDVIIFVVNDWCNDQIRIAGKYWILRLRFSRRGHIS